MVPRRYHLAETHRLLLEPRPRIEPKKTPRTVTDDVYSDVYLEKPVYGGRSIGSLTDGRRIMVANALPGETVDAVGTKVKDRYVLATTSRIVAHREDKNASPCPMFRVCGGCHWLTVPAQQQDLWKQSIAQEFFARFGMSAANTRFYPAEDRDHYRHRVCLRGQLTESGDVKVGYFAWGSHVQVPISSCFVAEKPINDLIGRITGQQLASPPTATVKFRLELQVLPYFLERGQPAILAIVHDVSRNEKALQSLTECLSQDSNVRWVGFGHSRQALPPPMPFSEESGVVYHTLPGSFQQVHRGQNRILREIVRTWVEQVAPPASRVLDLYAGSGNLSCQLGKTYRVDAVESCRRAITSGEKNTRVNKLHEMRFVRANVDSYLRQADMGAFDVVIADPARAGMKVAAKLLAERPGPNHLIYVSCNPSTAARDLEILSKAYNVRETAIFDFFPNTYHFESAFLLEVIS